MSVIVKTWEQLTCFTVKSWLDHYHLRGHTVAVIVQNQICNYNAFLKLFIIRSLGEVICAKH